STRLSRRPRPVGGTGVLVCGGTDILVGGGTDILVCRRAGDGGIPATRAGPNPSRWCGSARRAGMPALADAADRQECRSHRLARLRRRNEESYPAGRSARGPLFAGVHPATITRTSRRVL